MIADRGRLRVRLADKARTFHVGVLADCFFDPAIAVCLCHAAGDPPSPMISLCEPSRRPNACNSTPPPRMGWCSGECQRRAEGEEIVELQRLAVAQYLQRIEKVRSDIGVTKR